MRLLLLSAVFGIFINLFSIPEVNSNPCNGTAVNLTGTFGTISSPNYPDDYEDNLNCVWRIETPENTSIAIRFAENFTVEWSGSTCNYDYVEVDEPYKRWCGWFAPTSYVSTSNVLMVTFVSDQFITRRGFSFNWTAIDPSVIPEPVYTEIMNDQGNISSPNYPNNYPAFSNHIWKLEVSEGKSILLEFEPMFDLEQIQGCGYDYIAISETSTPFNYYDRLYICQFFERKMFYTNVLYIQFESDSINSGKGFSFNYTAIDDPPTCDGTTLQNGTSGVIESPEYPGKYPGGLDCTWHVTTAENTVIAVRFNTNFSLVSTGACYFEYLEVFDGPDSSSEQFEHKFCESWAPRSFVTTGNALTVRFFSSGFGDFSHIGFSMTWTAEENCNSDEFTCWDGTCIPESNKCDETMDCPNDIADEASCPKNDSVQCGTPVTEAEFKWHSRIIGGYEAAKGSWPWQGHLNVAIGSDELFLCGCVLISNRWVLTAAHCIFPGVDRTWVTFGDHDRRTLDGDEQVVTVEKIFVHPQYNWTDQMGFLYGYDIALLYLESPVNFTEWVKPVCFPNYEPTGGELVIRTGWGRTKYQGSISDVLRQVVAPVVTKEECSRLNQIPNISDSLLCVGLPFGGASTCSGDSGGPVVALQNGTWVVVGLTSFGTFCGVIHIPSAYANVYNLLPWINGVMANGLKEIVPQQIVLNNAHGIISSPNYGVGNYLQGFHQRWYIRVAEGKLIQIRFSEPFRIHQAQIGEPCGGDYLIIYDGDATSSRKYGDKKLCGYSRPLDMESATNAVVVEFFSNYDFEELGFSLSWTAVDNCAQNEFRCWDQTCLDASKKCNGVEDCPSKIDEFVCARATPGLKDCGKTEIAPKFPFSPQIIGGYNAEKGSWPWQVAIYVQFGTSNNFYCAGSLVSELWVLTAANCIVGSSYQVVIGGYNKSYESALLENRLIDVDVAFEHTGYNGLGRQTLFGMMKLATPVDFTSKWYKPACLPINGTTYPPPGSTCVVTGWGKTGPNERNTDPDILQQLPINILSDEDCYGGDPTLICAGYIDRDAGLCFNDIGGPLVCQKDGKWVQYGIASFGIGGCGHRALFERVSFHTDTIVDVITNLKVCKELEVIEGVTTGVISPPVIGGQYLESISCSWLIRGPPNTLINAKFEFFETEECDFLAWDFVNIYDGNSTSSRRVYDTTLCGDLEGLRGFESSSNELLISFFSDSSFTAKGFKIHFSIVEDCNLNQFRCWNGTCIDKSLQCDGKSDCYDQSDEKECAIRDGQCGKQEIVPDFLWHARVVGGHYAKNGSWPFVVQIEDSRWEEFLCAGTIVNDRWVLTLATPVELMAAEDLKVIVGTNELTPIDAVKYQVEQILFPSQFWMDYIGAIGLLKLKTSISFSATVQPACLSLPNVSMEPQPGEHCVALGWGASFAGERKTGPLRQTLVPILPEIICANKRIHGDSNRTFCSGESESGGRGACDYDEGGPIMCFRDNVWVQSGVITKSNSCGKPGVFEFYTRVSAYVNWIQMTTDTKLPSHIEETTSTTESTTASTTLTTDMTDSGVSTTTEAPAPNTTSTATTVSAETTATSTTSGTTSAIHIPAMLLVVAIIFQRIMRC